MENNTFLTFIAPIYNMEKYLDDFFASFMQLPKNSYELIVVDNNSSDSSVSICKKYSTSLNLKIILEKQNLGAGLARNSALEVMDEKTTHFVFIDSDDTLVDDLDFDKFLSFCDDSIKVNINHIVQYVDKTIIETLPKNDYKGCGTSVAWGNIFPVSSKDHKFNVRFFEDFCYMAKITSQNKYEYIDFPFIKIRRRKSSISNSGAKSSEKLGDYKKEIMRIKNLNLFANREESADKWLRKKIRGTFIVEGYHNGFKNIKWPDIEIDKKGIRQIVFLQRLTRYGKWRLRRSQKNYFE